jgi:hypothetical protein
MELDLVWVINAYNGNTEWLKEYTDNPIIYDKKDLNVGYNIYDYLDYIVNNYENLPKGVLFGKDNMLQRHITKQEFDECLKKDGFVPLLTQNHITDGKNAMYIDGMYHEINNSWYLWSYPKKYYGSYDDFAKDFDLPNPPYLPFAPGACYIVPRENIHKHAKEFYARLKELVSWHQTPAEAHLIERSLYNIWR